tara:strand:+ start:3470 stop:4219 length:750 start_codon:yes stop_codon:yes gene_type:complete
MINFFRKIRKKLADQNKPLKYLRYALGEIVLVMIGILLALQVNNWNEARKNQQELRNFLQGIVVDMKRDIRQVEIVNEELKEENERIKSFLNLDDYSGFTRDSLEQSLETFNFQMDYKINSFYMLRDSGITEYGKYEEVVTMIQYYYEDVIPYYNNIEETMVKSVQKSDEFWRFEQNAYEFNYEKELHSEQSDEAALKALNRLLKSPIPRNILKISYRKNKRMISEYDFYTERMNEVLKEMEDVLLEVD